MEGGLIIETAPLDAIGPVGSGATTVTVGAGAKWSDVARATLAHGLTPPVFTDYLELSVGGTLSVGGLGGQSHRHGAQTDNVTELQVVTGAGELVRCSPVRHRDLFFAVLAGLGQCAVVVGATVRLVRAPRPYATTCCRTTICGPSSTTSAGSSATSASPTSRARSPRRLRSLPGVRHRGRRLRTSAGSAPDDTVLLRGLRHNPSGAQITDLGYYDFLDRLAPGVAALKEAGLWSYAHPWLNLLLPGRRAVDLVGSLLDALTPADLGPGVVLLYPLLRDRLRTPLLRMPDDPVPYLFAVLRTTPPQDTATVERLLAANRSAYDTVHAAGGTQYPVGSIPFGRADWRRHFGPEWARLAEARTTYDPRGLLTPGQGIF